MRLGLALSLLLLATPAHAQLAAAMLPTARSVADGQPATAFAAIVNGGATTATGCGISNPILSTNPGSLGATFLYQTTDPRTNALVGTANTPASIPPGGLQTYLIALTPSGQPITNGIVEFMFSCAGVAPAPVILDVNTLRLSSRGDADVLAISGTPLNDGIVHIPGANGTGVFVVATTVLQGTSQPVRADVDHKIAGITSLICQTNPVTSVCLSAPSGSVSFTPATGARPTFAIFVQGNGTVVPPSDPAHNRVLVSFTAQSTGVLAGATSVAVQTD